MAVLGPRCCEGFLLSNQGLLFVRIIFELLIMGLLTVCGFLVVSTASRVQTSAVAAHKAQPLPFLGSRAQAH